MTLLVAPLADVRGVHQPSCRRVVLVAAAPVAFPFESVVEQLVEVVRAVGGSRGREAGGVDVHGVRVGESRHVSGVVAGTTIEERERDGALVLGIYIFLPQEFTTLTYVRRDADEARARAPDKATPDKH